jgi:hypothetical protein
MLVLKNVVNVTNQRPSKDEGTQVIALSTRGQIKLTTKAVDLLGVAVGSFIAIGKAGDTTIMWVTEKDSKDAKATVGRGSSKSDSNLSFSSTGGYSLLEGSTECRTHWNVNTEPAQAEVNGVVRTVYILEPAGTSAKSAKEKAAL